MDVTWPSLKLRIFLKIVVAIVSGPGMPFRVFSLRFTGRSNMLDS